MDKNEKEILNKILKSLKYTSKTSEEIVLQIFAKKGYIAKHHYYEDQNNEGIVIRELDFLSFKIKKNERDPQKQSKDILAFIGDVKLNANYKKCVIFGQQAFYKESDSISKKLDGFDLFLPYKRMVTKGALSDPGYKLSYFQY